MCFGIQNVLDFRMYYTDHILCETSVKSEIVPCNEALYYFHSEIFTVRGISKVYKSVFVAFVV